METLIRHRWFLVAAASVMTVLLGCARTSKVTPQPGYSVHVEKTPSGYEPLDVGDVGDLPGGEETLPERPSGPGGFDRLISGAEDAERYDVVDVIHFDYDRSDIKPEFVRGLQNNARWMVDHPDYQMLIEGHCDERGTNEYNMALGERRALTARNYLIQQGVEPDRVHAKSWGEEKPIAFGHDEASWWQNRRAEFKVARKEE